MPNVSGSAGGRRARTPPGLFSGGAEPDGAFGHVAPGPRLVEEAWQAWRAEVGYAEQFVTKAESLGIAGGDPWRGEVSLRFVLIHMIEEYARHNGHAGSAASGHRRRGG